MSDTAYSKKDVRSALAILQHAIVNTSGQIYVAAANLGLFYSRGLRLVSSAWIADEVTSVADERRYDQIARCAAMECLLLQGWLP